ncbi:hypothetical protein PLICRDRAFT_700290 [Plicaturopsis crispa FD-325 SS-3]|nr:hypothetical protein PLICRDRAFT_700290 [Plicaturopsis crispa FD-325 SS-3]
MHHCLQISEIMSLVCSELPCENGTVGLGELASLARTCRAFHDPALDVLWRTLRSLEPLIRTLPADLWEIRDPGTITDSNGNSIQHRAFVFVRPIEESDWTQFHVYAHRVRVLDFCHELRKQYVNHFDAGVPSALHVSAPALPLLPNLQTLALHEERSELVSHLDMLLHPKLTSFSCSITYDAQRLSLLPRLTSECPGLTSFAVANYCYEENQEWLITAISRVVGAWRSLTQLGVPILTSFGMEIVSALPLLQSLTIKDLELVDTPRTLGFPSLRFVEFHAPSLSTCIAFLSLLPPQHPALHTIKMTTDTFPGSAQSHSFFEALAKHCSPMVLKHIDLKAWQSPLIVPDIVAGMADLIPSLLPFHHLEHLSINIPSILAFDDATVRAMAASWPRLRVLRVLSTYLRHAHQSHPRSRGISATTFADLVTSCTELCELGIPVDTAAATGGCVKANTNLRALIVGFSKVPDIAETATFLSAVCPNLNIVSAAQDRDSWREVTRLITVRRQGRAAGEE